MNRLQKFVIRNSVQAILNVLAFSARRPALHKLTRQITHGLASMTIRTKGVRKAKNLAELGKMWQKGFPSSRQVPIKKLDERTVYAEIHTPCPLRGTGDLHACFRMMGFDRKVVEKAGGEFIVLASQASPGRTHCEVAMRFCGEDVSDLPPAHIQS